MEHLIQFGVTIDEEAIVRQAIANASRAIEKKAEEKIHEITYDRWGDSKLTHMFEAKIAEICEANKETIIEQAVEKVAIRITKSKVYKEAINSANFEGEE